MPEIPFKPITGRWQDIPTSAVWIAVSGTKWGNKRKSPEIVALDVAVAAYEQLQTRGQVTTAERSEALITILEAAEVYLASKGGKHSENRNGAVEDLKTVTRHLLARVRWQKYKEVTGGHQHNMKPMINNVWSEMHSPDHARVDQVQGALPPDQWLRGVEDGTVSEQFLFQYLRRVRQEQGTPRSDVNYVEDEQRWKYLVAFEGKHGIAKQRRQIRSGPINMIGDPITTGGEQLTTSIYAMDESGNLYFQPQALGGVLNHCSFLAGRPVLCAGTVGITAGILGYIDNGSGHYRPTRQHLVNCLEKLAESIHLEHVLVRDHAGPFHRAVYGARQFLDTRGHCRPDGYYKSLYGRYDENLHFFKNAQEAGEYIKAQFLEEDKKKLKPHVDQLAGQMQRDKRYVCQNDAERDLFKQALQMGIYERSSLDKVYKDDAPMQQWLQQNPGIK